MSRESASFTPVTMADWLAKVEKDLRGGDVERTLAYDHLDGLPLRVLEHEETTPTGEDPSGWPGAWPFTRGTRLPAPRQAAERQAAEPWTIGLDVDEPDLETARQALLHDLSLGAGAFRLRLHARDLEAFRRLLGGVDLSILEVLLDAGDPLLGAALLAEACDPVHDASTLRGCLGGDPIGELARKGRCELDGAFDSLAAAAAWCRAEAPALRAGELSALTWHEAGATPVQELGLTLAAAAETLRRLEARGLPPRDAAPQLLSLFAVGRETFFEIAKLRAWRLLFSKLLAVADVGMGSEVSEDAVAAPRLAVVPSTVHLTRVDPWMNLLRAAAQTFIAACAGADLVLTPRYDQALGGGELHSRRMAINLQHVLAQEAHLGRVADPAGGSWAIERMTGELARAAWQLFRQVEGEGGIVAALGAGTVQRRIAEKVALRRKRVAKRVDGIVGVSVFPLVGEKRPGRKGAEGEVAARDDDPPELERSVDGLRTLLRSGARLGRLRDALRVGDETDAAETCARLEPYYSADPFERLRLAVDDAVEAGAARPKILLAGLGSPAESRARREFASGLFAVAGLETVDAEGFGAERPLAELADAWAASDARAAVLCSSDERYVELAPPAAEALASAERLYLAGRPGEHEEAWRAAGITDFIYLGCDVAALLEELLEALDLPPGGFPGGEAGAGS